MKKIYSFLLLFVLLGFQCHFTSFGQTYTGNVEVFTQAEVDSFGALGYTRIDGSIRIGNPYEFQPNDITNLQPLLGLSVVDTGLFISNCSILNLNGLDSIKSVQVLDLMTNNYLQSIDALSQLDTVYNLWITFCSSLVNLNGLESLTTIENHCDIYINNSLQSLDGLDNLTSVGGFFRIAQNDNINSIEALGELTSIGSDLNIQENDVLETLNGLENLTTVADLIVNQNPNLEDFCALTYLVDNVGINGDYEALENSFNPTLTMLENGICSSTIGIQEAEYDFSVTLSPNPTTGNIALNFETEEPKNLEVVNQLGQRIYTIENITSPNFNLNLNDVPQGIYTVVLQLENNKQSFKVVKQ